MVPERRGIIKIIIIHTFLSRHKVVTSEAVNALPVNILELARYFGRYRVSQKSDSI